jgi:hypothetical protein
VTSYVCPKGHDSAESDFCDTCGARIDGTAAGAPVPEKPAAAGPGCPHCGAPRTGDHRFCEDCGFDHTTGKIPQLAPVAPPGDWTATVGPNRAYFDLNEAGDVTFPEDTPPATLLLRPPQLRIGRHSTSKGTDPELDLPDDPGVSHSHALLTLNIDGVWLVSDLGSTNGTWLNAP